MTTRIGVMVRVRPQLEGEKKKGHTIEKLKIQEDQSEIIVNGNDHSSDKCYQFTKVISETINQKQCFEETEMPEMINRVVEGFHSTIFAYGQTGSGKTFTMEGVQYENNGKGLKPQLDTEVSAIPNESMGIIPRTIIQSFETIKKYQRLKNRIYKVYFSYLQIYNEKIYDLLDSENSKSLRIRWSKKDQFSVENLFVFECQNAQEALQLFYKGIKNKFMATHKLNTQSSRSHCILTLRVDSMTAEDPDNIISSKMQLVDLAGSERASQSGVEGQNLKEAIEINKSLFTLRQVISALAEYYQDSNSKKEMPFVPYRDSKLTCLLKQSIGGNSYCLMIACLSPSDSYFDENISTLNYATQAGFITNQPVKNEDPRIKQINILKQKNSDLIKELHKANEHISFLSSLTHQNMKVFGQDYMSGKSFSPSGCKQTGMETPTRMAINNATCMVMNNENRNLSPTNLRRSHNPSKISNFLEGGNLNDVQKEIMINSQQIGFGNMHSQNAKNRDNILQPLTPNSPIRLQPILHQSFIGQVSPGSNLQTIKGFGESGSKQNEIYLFNKLDSENKVQQGSLSSQNQQLKNGQLLNSEEYHKLQMQYLQNAGVASAASQAAGMSNGFNGFGFTTLGQKVV